MDSDNPTLKWSLAAVGVVVVCFCLGYFVFGSKAPRLASEPSVVAQATPSPVPSGLPITVVDNQGLQIEDVTAEKEAQQKRKEEEERKKREAAQKAAEEALLEPTPAPEETPVEDPDVPTPSPEPDKTGENTEKEKPTPAPSIADKPTVTKETGTEPKDASAKSLYRVRVGGSFRSREEAEKTIELLRGRGYAAVIKADLRGGKKVYHVQVGAYSDSKSAERTKTEMENNGFDASIH